MKEKKEEIEQKLQSILGTPPYTSIWYCCAYFYRLLCLYGCDGLLLCMLWGVTEEMVKECLDQTSQADKGRKKEEKPVSFAL